MKNHKSQTK